MQNEVCTTSTYYIWVMLRVSPTLGLSKGVYDTILDSPIHKDVGTWVVFFAVAVQFDNLFPLLNIIEPGQRRKGTSSFN